MLENSYGIWVGENAIVALTPKISITFLKLKSDSIVSILKNNNDGTVAVVHGYKVESNLCFERFMGDVDRCHLLESHEKDEIIIQGETFTYKMYDGTSFNCVLSERIIIDNSNNYYISNNSDITIAQKLELWSLGVKYKHKKDSVFAQINTHKFSIDFRCFAYGNITYCRIGRNGYSEEGYALFPIICLRDGFDPDGKVEIKKELNTLDNLFESLNDVTPNLEYFRDDSCVAFPSDGGWYWSVKEITDDYISLYSCGGDIDIRYRNRDELLEVIV